MTHNPNSYLNRVARQNHGQKSEKKTAKRLNAKLRPASGAMAGVKGDMVLPDFLVENKSTVNESLSLKHDWLVKISREALHMNREPALSIQFVNAAGVPQIDGKWVLITESMFKELTEK